MANQPAPLPPDGIYRSILLVLVITILPGALFAQGAFRALQDKMDPRHSNGGIFLGLQGIVIKSHGGADEVAFSQAIHTAMIEVQKDVPNKIHKLWDEQVA